MRSTGALLGLRYKAMKSPTVVSFNKLPWRMLAADSPDLHARVAPQYKQLLTLCQTSNVPNILCDSSHLEIPKEQWLSVLPSTIYITPGIASAKGNDPQQFGPYGWAFTHVTDSVALQHYGPVEAAVGTTISDVLTYKSPDLRIICNVVVFRPSAGGGGGASSSSTKMAFTPNSTFGQIAHKSGNKNSKAIPDFVLYHFFRPNRPESEIAVPLQKYFRHPLRVSSSNNNSNSSTTFSAELFGLADKWEPLLDQPSAAKNTRLTPPAAFRPPTSYLPGLYERLAIKPGDSYGKRSLMWGTYY